MGEGKGGGASLPGAIAYPRLQQQGYGNAGLQSGATTLARLLLFEVDDFEIGSRNLVGEPTCAGRSSEYARLFLEPADIFDDLLDVL